MEAYLILYRSDDSASLMTAYTALHKYPTAELMDTKGATLADIDSLITALVAATYTRIISCVSEKRVEHVGATGVVRFSHGGTAGDVARVTITNGANTYTIGSVVSAAGSATDTAQLFLADVNKGTGFHGFVASGAAADITITSPVTMSKVLSDALVMTFAKAGVNLNGSVFVQFGAGTLAVDAVGGTGDISQAQVVALVAKMVADGTINAGTAQGAGGANNKVQLAASGPSAVNDFYNGMFVILMTNTGANQVRYISDYDGSTKTCTVDSNWGTNPDGTTTYVITDSINTLGRVFDGTTNAAARVAWDYLYPDNTYPKLLQYLTEAVAVDRTGSAEASAAKTLIDTGHAGTWSVNEFAGKWVSVYAGLGIGQERKIASNTADTLTIYTAWDDIPDTSTMYIIKDYQGTGFYQLYADLLILTYLWELSDTNTITTWNRLCDYGLYNSNWNPMVDGNGKAAYQDLDYLAELMAKAEAIWRHSIL